MNSFDALAYKDTKGDFNTEDEKLLIDTLVQDKVAGKVLDIGSGDGKLLSRVAFALQSATLFGIDNSKEQISLAKSLFPNTNFLEQDIGALSGEEEFDAAYSFYAFPHMPKSVLDKALSAAHHVLKPGASLYLFTNICLFNTSVASKVEQEACDITFLDGFHSQINLVSLPEMKQLIEEVGFEVVRDTRLKTGAKIKEYGEMISWVFLLKKS